MPIATNYPEGMVFFVTLGGVNLASGMWPAVSGAVSRSQALDVVANNLANMDTDGFKKDLPTFKEYLASLERAQPVPDIPRGPIKDKDLYPLDGRDQSFVVMDGTHTSFRQGVLKVTHSPLDVAIDGPAFFEISTPSGIRYTRQGSFKVAKDGTLVTTEGYPVLKSQPGGLVNAPPATAVQPGQGRQSTQGGVAADTELPPELKARWINLANFRDNLHINQAGEMYSGDDFIGKLGVTEFSDVGKLTKIGGLHFLNEDPNNIATGVVKSRIRQGVIETSNVNPVEEITNMIKAQRLYEHGMKTLRTYDGLMGKEANDIGKLY